jgi:hypothetical protein
MKIIGEVPQYLGRTLATVLALGGSTLAACGSSPRSPQTVLCMDANAAQIASGRDYVPELGKVTATTSPLIAGVTSLCFVEQSQQNPGRGIVSIKPTTDPKFPLYLEAFDAAVAARDTPKLKLLDPKGGVRGLDWGPGQTLRQIVPGDKIYNAAPLTASDRNGMLALPWISTTANTQPSTFPVSVGTRTETIQTAPPTTQRPTSATTKRPVTTPPPRPTPPPTINTLPPPAPPKTFAPPKPTGTIAKAPSTSHGTLPPPKGTMSPTTPKPPTAVTKPNTTPPKPTAASPKPTQPAPKPTSATTRPKPAPTNRPKPDTHLRSNLATLYRG